MRILLSLLSFSWYHSTANKCWYSATRKYADLWGMLGIAFNGTLTSSPSRRCSACFGSQQNLSGKLNLHLVCLILSYWWLLLFALQWIRTKEWAQSWWSRKNLRRKELAERYLLSHNRWQSKQRWPKAKVPICLARTTEINCIPSQSSTSAIQWCSFRPNSPPTWTAVTLPAWEDWWKQGSTKNAP